MEEDDRSHSERFAEILDEVPQYETFFTVAEHEARDRELAAEYDSVLRIEIGTTGGDEPIHALEVGDGAKKALFYAALHPNKLIG